MLLAASLVAGMGFAQGKKGGGSKGGGADMNMTGGRRQTRLDMIAEKLKLSKEQRDEVTKIFDNAQENTTPLNDQIRNGRGKITEMLISGKNSGEQWDGLMKAFTSVMAKREEIETEAFQKVVASLEEKQKKNAPVVFDELMAGMFEGGNWRRPPAGAGGGGMRGMGDGMSSGMGDEGGTGSRGGR
ncbi:MAG TPA: Spy/CpxP family protein refolding chaperone [Candidatus Sulfopaludibacter sp.]|nr:Spy/CpxP family protein refolding chaperone [Candidatus Sulfopaludibacter sp.]